MSNLYSMGNGLQLPPIYDPKVMTEDNSLETQLNKYPEISKKVIDVAPQFGVNYLLEKFGRISSKNAEKHGISDNAYRWKTRGHFFRPAFSAELSKINGEATNVAAMATPAVALSTVDQIFSIGVKHAPALKEVGTDFNPNDLIRFQSGTVAIVLKNPVVEGTVAIVTCKIVNGSMTVADLAADNVIGRIGTAFGEYSKGGYQNDRNEDWFINWTTTHRKGFAITGDAMSNVGWIVPGNGSGPLWYFEKINDEKKRFERMKESMSFYGRKSMTTTGHQIMGKNGTNGLSITGFNDNNGITAPVIGDGLLAQISDANKASFNVNTGFSDAFLTEYLARLAQRSIGGGKQGKEWVVLAGTKGRLILDKSFKAISGVTASVGGSMTDLQSGKDLSLGANFTTYHALGNKFVVMHYDLLDDPSLHNSSGGIVGTGDIIFMDWGLQDGVPNISMFHKKGRNHIEKNINGMHTLGGADLGGRLASSGLDGAGIEFLSQTMTVVKNPLSCGILKATGNYTGVVTDQAGQTAKDWFAIT
jgi:hypothetical protein